MTDLMAKPELELELEGTWEEILAHAPELAGRRVRIVVLPAPIHQVEETTCHNDEASIPPQNAHALATMQRWQETPLTQEEIAVLDEMEDFMKGHRFSLRQDQAKS